MQIKGIIVFVVVRCINILELLVLVRCILSWIPGLNNRFVRLIFTVTDLFLSPIRNALFKLMRGRMFMIDFSPFILYMLLELLSVLLYRLI